MRVAAIVLALAAASCRFPAEDEMRTTLEAYGFTSISLESAHFTFACGDDTMAMEFWARNAAGRPIHGHVCCGFLKACTVRF